MTRNKGRRARLGITWFALALGALALLAMPGLAAAKTATTITSRQMGEEAPSLPQGQPGAQEPDGDKLRNRAEFLAGDNPRNADSNGDGVMDGEDNAGTIASFDTESGKLVINLFGGETVSGLVNKETEIKCEDHSGASASSDGSGSEEEAESGDGNGGEEAEPGDDNGAKKRPATTTAARVRKSPLTTTAAKKPATTGAKTPAPVRGTKKTKPATAPPPTSFRAQSSRRRS